MPPPLPTESESESVATDTTPTRANPSAQVDDELADAVNETEKQTIDEVEDDDGEVAEDEYVVEAILNHHSEWEDQQTRYEVKWKGYEKKSDRTWETEDNLAGAIGILKAYWAKIGGKPAAVSKSASKKRGRQSSGRESGTPDITSAKKQKKARRKSALAKNDGTPEPPVGYTTVGDDDWQPPKAVKDAWEDGVQSVDTIEKDDEGDLWAYLVWNGKNEDGRYYRHKAKLAVCNKACPQKMLQFYEKHVVFTNSRTPFTENGATAA